MGQNKKERVKRPSRPKPVAAGPVSSDPMPGWLKTDKALAAGESFFRPVDWLAFGITTLVTLLGYCLTISPDLSRTTEVISPMKRMVISPSRLSSSNSASTSFISRRPTKFASIL